MSKKLRDSGFLTRDGRMKERKKYGRKGARKSFQFSKHELVWQVGMTRAGGPNIGSGRRPLSFRSRLSEPEA